MLQQVARPMLDLQLQRKDSGFQKSSFLAAVKQCGRLRDLSMGKELQAEASKCGLLKDVCVGNSFITMFAKCGSMSDAQMMFDSLLQRSVVSWNALLHGYLGNGESLRALELFDQMLGDVLAPAPNSRTFVAVIAACGSLGARGFAEAGLERGRSIHSQAEISRCCDMFVESALVDMYSKFGDLLSARRVFERMVRRDVVAWSCLIQGYAENGEPELALELLSAMVASGCAPNARTYVSGLVACAALGKPGLERGEELHSQSMKSCSDVFVETAAIDMYAKCRCLDRAKAVFKSMTHRNVVAWNSLMQGCVENGESELAVELFEDMVRESECTPDARSFVAALNACACSCSASNHTDRKKDWLEKAKCLHAQALRSSELNAFVENSLLNTYLKCGSLTLAGILFDARARRDKFCWSSIIRGLVDNKEQVLGLEMLAEMMESGTSPDSATFVAALMACGSLMARSCGRALHAGVNKCGLESDLTVATCLMELYSKCGSLASARQVFDSIAEKDTRVWNALMLGYSEQGEVNGALELLEMMVEQGAVPDEASFVHILSACSHSGMSSRGKECLERMEVEYGVKPGIEHYACLIDLLGRENQVEEALKLIEVMPMEADSVIWHSLLNSSMKWKNVAAAEVAYKALLRLGCGDACAYVSMAQVFHP